MAKPLISDILKEVNKISTRDERIAYLQEHDCTALRDILRIALDDAIKLALPDGAPPYKAYNLEAKQAESKTEEHMKELSKRESGRLALDIDKLELQEQELRCKEERV